MPQTPNSPQSNVSGDDWLKVEYGEINQYGRAIYDSFFKLSQMSFVLNPALAAAFIYILSEFDGKLKKVWLLALLFSFFISFIGLVYNLGALLNFVNSHQALRSLFDRMKEIEVAEKEALDKRKWPLMHQTLKVIVPPHYDDPSKWKLPALLFYCWNPRNWLSVDYLTICFFEILMGAWLVALVGCVVVFSRV